MNQRQARELERALSERGNVTVTPEQDGARIEIEAAGGTGLYVIGDGPSALLNHLLGRRDG